MLGKSYCAMLCVPLTVFGVTAHHMFYLCSCGGIGIRVGFRNQIFRVQISAGTPYGHIAQLAEHLTFNQGVGGSSLPMPTIRLFFLSNIFIMKR